MRIFVSSARAPPGHIKADNIAVKTKLVRFMGCLSWPAIWTRQAQARVMVAPARKGRRFIPT
jgi:hypothetical protein